MTSVAAVRSLRAAFVLAMLLACAGPAVAGLPNESAATAAGQTLVETAAAGRVGEAFKAALALSRPNDAVLGKALQAREPDVRAQVGKLGVAAGTVRLADIEPSIFSGCMRREYRVQYAGGDQRWLVKFRRTTRGWALADLEVVSRLKTGSPTAATAVPDGARSTEATATPGA